MTKMAGGSHVEVSISWVCTGTSSTTNHLHFLHRSLVSYSDGCGGQNKNGTIIGFYVDLHTTGMYEQLDHKYLEWEHAFLENDTDFSQKRQKSERN